MYMTYTFEHTCFWSTHRTLFLFRSFFYFSVSKLRVAKTDIYQRFVLRLVTQEEKNHQVFFSPSLKKKEDNGEKEKAFCDILKHMCDK